jgi:cobalt-zinc-cadmium efflux system membrane fusion protein
MQPSRLFPVMPAWASCFLALCALGCQEPSGKSEAVAPQIASEETVRLSSAQLEGPVKFQVAPVTVQSALPLPPVTGRVTTVATLTSPTFAPLSGRVASVAVRLGSKVEKGECLVEIRAAELSTLRRDVESARLAVQTKQALVERLEQLVASRIAAESDLLVARSELKEARLAATTAAERLAALALEPSGQTTYWLKAARAGTVVALSAVPGQHVAPEDAAPLVVIADLDQVLVEADVAPRDAGEIVIGQTAQILGTSGASVKVEGRVESVSEVVDPVRQVVPVRIAVQNEARVLRPNAFVNVVFEGTRNREVVIVPSAAVVSDGARAVVFVEREPGVFERRTVELGRRTRDAVEVISGLLPVERVVTSGALLLLNALDMNH